MFNTTTHPPVSAHSAELHRHAFNAAFRELGLRWYWDADTYRNLSRLPGEPHRVQAYLESQQPHLLRAYDADFLIDVITTTKARRYESLAARGAMVTYKSCVDLPESELAEVGF